MRDADRQAFDTALLSHVGLIRHIGRSRLDEQAALDDFTQEVLTSACAHRDRHGEPLRLSRWLATVARNMATDWNRKQRPTPVAALPAVGRCGERKGEGGRQRVAATRLRHTDTCE